jgi:glycerol-3-phosphate dehydrogenase
VHVQANRPWRAPEKERRAMMEHRVIQLGGPVHYLDFGGSGPTMVLVHGLGGSAINWLSVAPLLAERHRVVALDLPGFGRTPPISGLRGVTGHRELLDRFLAAVAGGPAAVIGNSMGGLIAMMEAAAAPDRVARLVLAAPVQPNPRGGRIDREVLAVFAAYAIPWLGSWYLNRRAVRLGPEGLVREMMRLCCADPSRVAEDVRVAHVALAAERIDRMPWSTPVFLDAARSLMGAMRRRARYEAMVGQIGAPTLVIQGDRDRLVPLAASRALAARRPDWTLDVLDDIGHVPQIEDPERFARVTHRWIDGLQEPAAGVRVG